MIALVLAALLIGCSFKHGELRSDGQSASDDSGGDGAVDDDASISANGWRRRIGWSGVTADLAEFPLLVVLDNTRIEYGATQPSGADLRFVDATSQQPVPHQIEHWDPAGRSFVWVKAPLVDAAGTRSIWMYYGDADTLGTPNAPAVWSDSFVGVWHLGEPVADEVMTGSHADATGNGHIGLQRGNSGELHAGGIGLVQRFDGTADMIEIATTSITLSNAVTIEVRAWCSVQNLSYPHVLAAGSDGRYWQVFWDKDTGDAGWAGALRIGGTDERIRTASGLINEWRSLAIVYDGATVTLYMDGAAIGTSPATGTVTALDTALYLGANPVLGQRDLTGYLDELRIASVMRSAPWLVAAHRAQKDSLLTYGPREAVP